MLSRASLLPSRGPSGARDIRRPRVLPELSLGAGELGILSAISQEEDPMVVSDDRRSLSILTTRGAEFLTPADMLVVLASRGVLTGAEAGEALERLRPAIGAAAYWETRKDLELRGGNP